MTAEPRPVEEIRADLVRFAYSPPAPLLNEPKAAMRLIRDVEPLLARLAAADRENASGPLLARLNAAERERDFAYEVRENSRATNVELRGEVERLRELVTRQLGDCIGCSPETGPEETCPHDGRTYTEWVEIASMVIGRQHANEAERDDLRAQLAAAQAQLAEAQTALTIIRVWANTKHGGVKTPAEVWPGLNAALSAAPQPEPWEERLEYGHQTVEAGWVPEVRGIKYASHQRTVQFRLGPPLLLDHWSDPDERKPFDPQPEPPASDEPARCEP